MEMIINSIIGLVITAVGGLLGKYLLNLNYVKNNEKIERTLENAINWAEATAKKYLVAHSKKMVGSEKLATAKKYLDKIDPALVSKYGDKLDLMIERKINQLFVKNDK